MITDEQLMERYASTGDMRAFSELYARMLPLVRRVVQRQLTRASEVDDVAQQTFLKLHTARAHYRAGERLKPWLCAIAVNTSRDHQRRERRRPESHAELDQLVDPSSCEPSTRSEARALPVLAAVEALPAATRLLFRLHFFEDRPLAEIARSLDEKPSTVRVRLHRGCRRLHAELLAS